MKSIKENIKRVLDSLPEGVILEAAAKTRSAEQVQAAIEAGVNILGYNYVQEAEEIQQQIQLPAKWHMIGHLQKNKVKKAVALFDMIETVDSVKLGRRIDKHCAQQGFKMPILIEVNSAREENKAGVYPENVPHLVQELKTLAHIQIQGLMTMGPLTDDTEHVRPYFRETRELFERVQSEHPDLEIKYLSMGMSESYKIAIEEGANIVRLGTLLFGPREYSNS